MDVEIIKSGIVKLDSIMGGGIPRGHIVLIEGTTGTMKSTLSFQILYQAALEGKNCVYVCLEQSASSVLTQISLMGYDLSKIGLSSNDPQVKAQFPAPPKNKKTGTLHMIDISLIRKTRNRQQTRTFSWLKEIMARLSALKKKGVSMFVLDSLNALLHMDSFGNTRIELFRFFEFLRDLNLTSLIIKEITGKGESYNPFEIESKYLSDGVIKLALNKAKLSVKRELNVVKMRYTNHLTDFYVFNFEKKTRFTISEKITEDED